MYSRMAPGKSPASAPTWVHISAHLFAVQWFIQVHMHIYGFILAHLLAVKWERRDLRDAVVAGSLSFDGMRDPQLSRRLTGPSAAAAKPSDEKLTRDDALPSQHERE